MKLLDAARAARQYLRAHPQELTRAARNALGLRMGVPIAALRWLAERAEHGGKVRDVHVEAVPPGLRLAASFEAMHTPLRAAATVYVERLHVSDEELTVTLRVEDLDLKVEGEAQTPVAALVKSGALDLSKPGNLVAYLPQRPPIIVDARDNRITLDLLREPRLRDQAVLRAILAVLTSLATVQGIGTEGDYLEVAFRPLPRGLRGPVSAVRERVVPLVAGRLLRG